MAIIVLIISIIAFITSFTTFVIVAIETTPWGESELIDNLKEMLYRIEDKRIERYWKRH